MSEKNMDDIKTNFDQISATMNSISLQTIENIVEKEGYALRKRELDKEKMRIKEEIDRQRKQIETDTMEIKYLKDILEGLKYTHRLNTPINANMRILMSKEDDNIETFKAKYEEILKQYETQYEKNREHSISKNPIYKKIESIKIEIKKREIRQRMKEQERLKMQYAKKQYDEIQKKMFYADIVQFAENWLALEKLNKLKEKYAECKKQEDESHGELIEIQKKLKEAEIKSKSSSTNSTSASNQLLNMDDDISMTQLLSDIQEDMEIDNTQLKVDNRHSGNIDILDINIIAPSSSKKPRLTPPPSVYTPPAESINEDVTESISEAFQKFLKKQESKKAQRMNSSIMSLGNYSQSSLINTLNSQKPRLNSQKLNITQQIATDNIFTKRQFENEVLNENKKTVKFASPAINTVDNYEYDKEIVVEPPNDATVTSKYFSAQNTSKAELNITEDLDQFVEDTEMINSKNEEFNLSSDFYDNQQEEYQEEKKGTTEDKVGFLNMISNKNNKKEVKKKFSMLFSGLTKDTSTKKNIFSFDK